MSLKLECLLNWNVTQMEMSLKLENYSILNNPQFQISLKLKCLLNWNVNQIGMSVKLDFHLNWNVTKI